MTPTQTRQWNKAKKQYLYAPKGKRMERYQALKDFVTMALMGGI